MIYSSLENNTIKEIKKLNQKKYRDLTNTFLIEGEHLVEEAFKNKFLKTLIIEEGYEFKLDINTLVVTHEVMKQISSLDTPYKVMGIANKKLENENIGNRILILDEIQDPGNLGTIIRSAVAFNIDTIVLSNNTVDLYNSKVVRATQGLMFYTNIVRKDLKSYVLNLKEKNYKIMGTDVTGGNSLKNVAKEEKFAIIMGNEGNGMHEDIKKLCDSFLYIDVNPNCESLNVGVATSIILYELDK